VPRLCMLSRSSVPKEGVSFEFSTPMASWIVVRVASGILPTVLLHTSVTMESMASSSFPSRHQPLCLLFSPSILATSFASRKGSRVSLLSPSGWVQRIQLSVVERMGINCCFSSPFRFAQSITIGCGVEVFFPNILSFHLPAFLIKGRIIRSVSPWYLVAWLSSFAARSTFQA